MNGCPSRVLASVRMLGEIATRSGRRAERTPAYSDRADRLKPNIVFSKRDSYQRRGHLTVCKAASYRLTLPRTDMAEGTDVLGNRATLGSPLSIFIHRGTAPRHIPAPASPNHAPAPPPHRPRTAPAPPPPRRHRADPSPPPAPSPSGNRR